MPMEIGIHEKMRARFPDGSKSALNRAFRKYTRSMLYLAARRDMRARHDLDGNPVAKMDPEHSEQARKHFAILARRRHRIARCQEAEGNA